MTEGEKDVVCKFGVEDMRGERGEGCVEGGEVGVEVAGVGSAGENGGREGDADGFYLSWTLAGKGRGRGGGYLLECC